ncbi:hypothetical protein AAG906_009745 [Vitis piasezkii]
MEDSTAMTIEFLRARLLSERSVSRTARQRADELAQRVWKLEEQLKIVSIQRNKAEKATADVLAILENHAVSDVSWEFDSSSDQEVALCDSHVGGGSTKEVESSVNSKSRRNDADGLSSSELEFSPSTGRRLSWKSSKDSSRSIEKRYLDCSIRRRRSFASSGSSSPKHNLGKSCRQIRRRETRSAVDELKVGRGMVDSQNNGIISSSEGLPNGFDSGQEILREGSENQEEEVLMDGQVSDSLESQRDATGSNHHLNRNGRDRDMERALEHQAQLIGQYEAEEKAQREWEEKFRENNSSTPDSCEPGNHSDVTEERDEVKPQAPSAAGILTSQDQGTKLDDEDVHFNEESSQTLPTISTTHLHGDMECLQEQNHSSMLAYESLAPDFVFPMAKENLHQDSHHYPWSHVSPGDHSANVTDHSLHVADHPADVRDHSEHVRDHSGHSTDHSADATDHSGHITDHSEHVADHSEHVPLPSYVGSKGESSRSQDKHYALVPRETSNELGGVLEALQQARLSLQHKLNRLPLIEGGSVGRAIEPSFPSTRAWERVEIPVGCTGLFRVPADYQLGTATEANFLGSDSQSSLKNYYPDTGFVANPGDRFLTSPYLKTGSSVPTDDSFLTNTPIPLIPHIQICYIGCPLMKDLQDPSNSEVGIPSTDHFSFYDDHIRPNMYR